MLYSEILPVRASCNDMSTGQSGEGVWERSVTRARHIVLCGALVSLCHAATASAGSPSDGRKVRVEDSITMTTFGDLLSGRENDAAVFAPDRKHFVVETCKGVLKTNSNDCSLLLYATTQVQGSTAPPMPTVLATLSSRSEVNPGIWRSSIRWSSNSIVVFLGVRLDEPQQAYACDIVSGKIRRLTNHPTDVVDFDVSSDMRTIAYNARPPISTVFDEHARREGLLVTHQFLTSLMLGHSIGDENGVMYHDELYIQSHGETRRIRDFGNPTLYLEGFIGTRSLFLSPDGKHLAIKLVRARQDAPSGWSRYEGGYGHYRRLAVPDVYQWSMVNVANSLTQPVVDAPIDITVQDRGPIWVPDSSKVIFPSTYLPLDGVDDAEAMLRRNHTYAVAVVANSLKVTKVAIGSFSQAAWSPEQGVLTLTPSKGRNPQAANEAPLVRYRQAGGDWVIAATSPESPPTADLRIDVEQGINSPPKLVAKGSRGSTRILLDPNPQFKNLSFGVVKEIQWRSKAGEFDRGGLYLPPDFVGGHRYALVIQTHGWDASKFWIDGFSWAGYAAQALAGEGILVAQINDHRAGESTPMEGPNNLTMYEGLIDYLDRQGFIDRTKVGLLGFSRTGYGVRYALAHAKYPIAAAVIVDGMDAGYGQYMLWINQGEDAVHTWNQIYGAPPFGMGLKSWMHNAPDFNLDKYRTPLRLIASAEWGLPTSWETFGGLQYLRKPVEFIWMGSAYHAPILPHQRLTTQQGDVDWFRFWLNGAEDPDPAKRKQYERWERLCDMQKAEKPARPTSCLSTRR